MAKDGAEVAAVLDEFRAPSSDWGHSLVERVDYERLQPGGSVVADLLGDVGGWALLAERGDVEEVLRSPAEAFAEAVELGSTLAPFHRARNQLLYGEWLRRERSRREARVHLRAASELFRALGAAPWEERAAAELRATGETARKRDPSTLDQLTPQELQIADLVADGLTNREIATQLYLSPRTIEYHLRKVFSKLGIASRSELIRRGRRPENTR